MSEAPPKGRRRRLSEDEIELWLTVAASVSRRLGSSVPDRVLQPAPAEPAPAAPTRRTEPAAPPVPTRPPPLVPLERRLKQKLSRGRMTADAAIDLHGFRQSEAHRALYGFLRGAQADGARVVLVVTGKGGRPGGGLAMDGDTGVLRRAVPLWLTMPEFRTLVVGYEEAARQHGGSGALYVRLRRRDRG